MATEMQSAAKEAVAATLAATNARDPDGLVAQADPAWTEDVLPVGRLDGAEAVRAFYAETFAAFPDFRLEVERLVGEGQVVVAEWRLTGTFSDAPFQGIAPTGRQVELRGVDVFDVEDGRIVRSTIYYDGATFARQIGMLPTRGSLGDRSLVAAFNTTTRTRRLLSRLLRRS